MFNEPIKGLPFTFWIGLPSQSDPKTMQSNPTLAAGDAKVSKDGGALANLGTLPAVTPASSKLVKVVLSATEMAADNVTVILSDASGAEWCDVVVDIRTVSGIVTGGQVSDGSPTSSSFLTTLTEGTDDHYNGMVLVFLTGVLAGQARKIGDYAGTPKQISVVNAFTEAPGNNDKFAILGRIE